MSVVCCLLSAVLLCCPAALLPCCWQKAGCWISPPAEAPALSDPARILSPLWSKDSSGGSSDELAMVGDPIGASLARQRDLVVLAMREYQKSVANVIWTTALEAAAEDAVDGLQDKSDLPATARRPLDCLRVLSSDAFYNSKSVPIFLGHQFEPPPVQRPLPFFFLVAHPLLCSLALPAPLSSPRPWSSFINAAQADDAVSPALWRFFLQLDGGNPPAGGGKPPAQLVREGGLVYKVEAKPPHDVPPPPLDTVKEQDNT